MTKPPLGIGLIGSGFMGKAHALGYSIARQVFDLPFAIDLAAIADIDEERAAHAAHALGFRRSTGAWRDLLADPAIHVINIAAPNTLHKEMALAAIAAGKHVYCEKPLAPTAADCEAMARAAEAAGVMTQVGFNYLKNPMLALAKTIIQSGEIGEITSFRGIHAEDFMTDPASPWTWRLDPAGGGGALADLGSHILAAARYLIGPISEVMGDMTTVVVRRPVYADAAETKLVEVEDIARALIRFESGVTGSIEANWMASGRKMQHDFEIYGSKGGLLFTQERLNELRLHTTTDQAGRRGFRTVFAGPEHEPYGAFCVAGGHQIGFNDLKAIEARDFLQAVAGGPIAGPDFVEGWAIQRLIDAIYRSTKQRQWIRVGSC